MNENNLLVLSANCQGLSDQKRVDVIHYVIKIHTFSVYKILIGSMMTKYSLKMFGTVNVLLMETEPMQEVWQF